MTAYPVVSEPGSSPRMRTWAGNAAPCWIAASAARLAGRLSLRKKFSDPRLTKVGRYDTAMPTSPDTTTASTALPAPAQAYLAGLDAHQPSVQRALHRAQAIT